VRITDSALVAAAMLSHRYISDRFLPDKAIDLVDEAASHIRMEATSMPLELDEVMRRITQLEIEREGLRKEKDPASQERLRALEQELANLREQANQLRALWQQEMEELNRIARLQEQIDAKRTELEQAKLRFDWERAAQLQYEVQQLERQLDEAIKARETSTGNGHRLVKEEVDAEDIA
jgi:ATP-dependent Clp protease ATP-binding subunit ClpB